MRALGISCRWDHGRVTATFVVVDGNGTETLVESKVHSSGRHDDVGLALADLYRDAVDIVTRLSPKAVVVRAPDRPPGHVRVSVDATRNRGLSDGVLLAAARESVENVRTLTGREIGVACGSNKESADAEGRLLVNQDNEAEAAAAALAAVRS